jgi:hypothetical protein
MQKRLVLFFILLLMTTLVGCSLKEKKDMRLVSKVGVEHFVSGGNIIEAYSSLEINMINSIKEIIEKINWDKNLKKNTFNKI